MGLAAQQRLLGLLAPDCNAKAGREAFEEVDHLESETVLASIVEMEQADHLLIGANRDQGHGQKAFMDAAVARLYARIVLLQRLEQRKGIIGPYAAGCRDIFAWRSALFRQHHPAGALEAELVISIPADSAILAAENNRTLGEQEIPVEAFRAEIGKVVATFQPYTHGVETGFLLDQFQYGVAGLLQPQRLVEDAENSG